MIRRPSPDPNEPCAVYRLFALDESLLYVGISKYPWYRWRQHAAEKHWWYEVEGRSVEWFPTRKGASEAEAVAIWLELPRYNITRPYSDDEMVYLKATAREPRLNAIDRRNRDGEEWSSILADLTTLVGPGALLPARAGEVSLAAACDLFCDHLERISAVPAEMYDPFLRSADTIDVVTQVLRARRPVGVP